jgi:hypothetical protein
MPHAFNKIERPLVNVNTFNQIEPFEKLWFLLVYYWSCNFRIGDIDLSLSFESCEKWGWIFIARSRGWNSTFTQIV